MNNNDAVFEHIINQLRAHNASNPDNMYQAAFEEWIDKTQWVQSDKRFDILIPLGKHRADVLREYIMAQESSITALKNQLRDSAEQIKELHAEVEMLTAALSAQGVAYCRMHGRKPEPEQAGCRKGDTQVEEPWIKWEGGARPVPPGALVEVEFRDGSSACEPGVAGELRWDHRGWSGDVIHYRVVKPECQHPASQLCEDTGRCTFCGKVVIE